MTQLNHYVAGDPAAPPMVLLHGLGDDAQNWDNVLPGLAEKRRVYALDLRGHGRSPHPGQYSFELMRDDVLGFLDQIGVGPGVLLGHSMGGTVAVLLAQAEPHRLTHLILEDVTAPRPGALKRPPLPPPDEPTPFDFAAVNAIRAQINDPDPAWWDGLAGIAVPTLIIGGADSPIPHELLVETVELMPDAQLVTLPAGHNVHRDRPAEYLAAVDDFLASPQILAVSWGRIEIAGVGVVKDAKLYPGGGRAWDWTETGTRHSPGVQPADVEELLQRGATAVVLSRGMDSQLQVSAPVLEFLEQRNVEVHVAETKEAVEIYNELAATRPVGGLFHSTC